MSKGRPKATYIIYYTDKHGSCDGYEVYGHKELMQALKWLHSEEVKASRITVYKRGRNFDNDHDDVIEITRYWK